jgi:hypothetical protein
MSDEGSTASRQVWRVSPSGRIAAVAVAAMWLAVAAGFTAAGVSAGALIIVWLSAAVIAIGAWRWAFAPYVALQPDCLVVQNRLVRTSVRYKDIVEIRPGYSGVFMRQRDGDTVTAWAVQKSNVRRWQGATNTRADELVHAIQARRTERG